MRTLNRIKKQRRPFTKEHFYIHHCDNGIYQFRDSETHMVISTSCDLTSLKRCIVIVLNRYKNYDLYLRAVSSMSEKTVSAKDLVIRQKEYKRTGKDHVHIIEDLIKEFYLEQEEIEDFKRRRVILPVAHLERAVEVETSPKPQGPIQLHKKRRSRL